MVCNNFWKLKEEKGYWTSSNQFTVIKKADMTDTEKKIVITNLLFDALDAAQKLCLIPI